MSSPILPETRGRLGLRDSLVARVATATAFVVTALPPRGIRVFLAAVAKGGRPARTDEVLAWRTAANTVSRRCAGLGCLQRSIAVMLLARFHGVAPVWKTGFRPDPFVAHAWVEAEGEPVGEPDVVSQFRIVLSVDPHA